MRHKEVFAPLAHPPGDAQADFGEALVVIGGVEKVGPSQFLVMSRSASQIAVLFRVESFMGARPSIQNRE